MAPARESPREPDRAALTSLLIGGLLVLAGWALATSSTYSESATVCPSLLGRDLIVGSMDVDFCSSYVSHRLWLVLPCLIVGVVLIAFGAVRGRSALFLGAGLGGRLSAPTRVALTVLGLITIVFATPLLVLVDVLQVNIARATNDVVNAVFPIGIAAASLAVAGIAVLVGRRGHRMTLDHSVTAVSLSAPLLTLILIDLDGLLVNRRAKIDPELTSDTTRFLLCAVPVALALLMHCWLQNTSRPAPPAGISGLALLGSAAALFVAMTPEAFSGGWGTLTWQTPQRFLLWVVVALAVPWLTSMLWWAQRPNAGDRSDAASTSAPRTP